MKLIWLTDTHLNFLHKEDRMSFYQKIKETSGNKVVITGDIADAPSISSLLTEMAKAINIPIYFVLGNHDYYHGSVDLVRQEMIALTEQEPLLHWLPIAGVQHLGHETILLGQDTWADGRYGDYANSLVSLNDSRMIADLFQSKILGKYALLDKMQELADKDANHLKVNLINAIKNQTLKKIIIALHVPPFPEASLYEGKMSNDDFLPFFTSKATGDVLLQISKENRDIEFLVLCGHTHSKAYWAPRNNLIVKVGAADYGKPEIQETISI